MPGLAWGSPIVWGDKVFVTTCVNTGETTEPRKGLYIEDVDANKYPKPKDPHEWKVVCLDLNSGKQLWEQVAFAGIPAKPHHLKNTLASETPTTDGERVYAYFGNVGLFVYDMDGKPLWQKLFPPQETQYGWGTSISPILYEDRMYIVNDNEREVVLRGARQEDGRGIAARRARGRKDQLRHAVRVEERPAHGAGHLGRRLCPVVRSRQATCCGRSKASRSWRFPRRSSTTGCCT